jgi:very-short-patch-repair endonuclease
LQEDRYWDEFLKSLEIGTLRVKDEDILCNIPDVTEMIKYELSMK